MGQQESTAINKKFNYFPFKELTSNNIPFIISMTSKSGCDKI